MSYIRSNLVFLVNLYLKYAFLSQSPFKLSVDFNFIDKNHFLFQELTNNFQGMQTISVTDCLFYKQS